MYQAHVVTHAAVADGKRDYRGGPIIYIEPVIWGKSGMAVNPGRGEALFLSISDVVSEALREIADGWRRYNR